MIVSTQEAYQTRQNLWNSAQNLNFPSVLWRLPNHSDKHFLCSFQHIPQRKKIDFEELGSGFAFSPFHNPEGTESLFLNADIHYIFKKNSLTEELHESHSPSPMDENLNLLLNFPDNSKKISSKTKQIPEPSPTKKCIFWRWSNRLLILFLKENFKRLFFLEPNKFLYPNPSIKSSFLTSFAGLILRLLFPWYLFHT